MKGGIRQLVRREGSAEGQRKPGVDDSDRGTVNRPEPLEGKDFGGPQRRGNTLRRLHREGEDPRFDPNTGLRELG